METREQTLIRRRREYQDMVEASHKLGSSQKDTMMEIVEVLSDALDLQENQRRLLLTL